MNLTSVLKKPFNHVVILATVFAMVLTTSCKDDPEPEPVAAAPTVTLSASTASGLSGAAVSTTVTLNAPAGLRNLRILKKWRTRCCLSYSNFNWNNRYL